MSHHLLQISGSLDLKQPVSWADDRMGICILDIDICERIVWTIFECTPLHHTLCSASSDNTMVQNRHEIGIDCLPDKKAADSFQTIIMIFTFFPFLFVCLFVFLLLFLAQCIQFQHYPDPVWSAVHCCCQYSSRGSEWCCDRACQCTICQDSHPKCVHSLHNNSLIPRPPPLGSI